MTIELKRKRSKAVGLTAIGALSMVTACSSPSEDELSRAEFGETKEVSVFQNATECANSFQHTEEQCREAEKTAWNQDNESAPRFEDQRDCEDQFGNGNCRSGSGFFMPMMTGFMIGQFLSGSRYRYGPLYKDKRSGTYFSGSGGWIHKNKSKNGKFLIGQKAFDPVKPTVQTRSQVASRGGFGSRSAMGRGGGWGG
jgi:uncharacterized protein YgiB involved in biofilm formation